jgi:hypothetical protein
VTEPALYVASEWGAKYHSLTHNEALGAGSAGPGKSLVLLMDPLPRVLFEHKRCELDPTHPLFLEWGKSKGWALHLRRTLPMLRQTIERANQYFPAIDPSAKGVGLGWSAADNTFTFSSGYKVEFGHCREKTDYQRYLSNQYDWLGLDELVQFEEEQYDQLSLRVRSDDPVLMKQLKIRAMSNPLTDFEGMEGVTLSNPQWVRDRFVRPCPQGGKTHWRWITRRDGTREKRNWIYLRATLYDNPNKEFVKIYEAQLLAGKPHLRQAYLEGDWEVTAGSFFADVWDAKIHICDPFKVPKDWLRFRSMDWGFKAPGVIHWWAMDPDGNLFCIREHRFQGKKASEVAKDVKDIEGEMNLWTGSRSAITGPADTQLWEERGVTAMSMAEEFMRAGVPWLKAEKGPGSRARNAARIYQRLEDHGHHTTTPGIVFFRGCRYIIQTLPGIQTDPKDINSPQDGGEDHAFDSTAYACAFASRGRLGIPKRLNDDDDYDLPPKPREEMGRYGYGGRLH